MEKRVFVLLSLVFLIVNFASASYICANDTQIISGTNEIELGDKESINGLFVGMSYGDLIRVYGYYEAELIIGAQTFSLTDSQPSYEVEFEDIYYNVSLVNVSEEYVSISIDGNTMNYEKNIWKEHKGFVVSLNDIQGEFPGSASVDVLIGEKKANLSNSAPQQVITYKGKEYLIELVSSSQSYCIVKISYCDGINISFEYMPDPVNETINETAAIPAVNQTSQNNSINDSIEASNQTEENRNVSGEENDSINDIIIPAENNKRFDFSANLNNNKVMIIILSNSIIIIVLIVWFFKKKSSSKALEIRDDTKNDNLADKKA